MKKDISAKPFLFPISNYMLGTYNDDDSVDVMIVGWGGCVSDDYVTINILEEHQTFSNIEKRSAFTLAIPTLETMAESDFLGIVSAAKMKDKFERTGFHAVKSNNVDAHVIEEYLLTMECQVEKITEEPYGSRILAKIVNILADDKILDDRGRIDVSKFNTFVFDQMQNRYFSVGEKVGKVYGESVPLMKK